MRQNYLKLTIPSPCSQSWEGMAPVSGGRFCTHCQHVVTDITGMDDRELAVLFRSKDHPVCVQVSAVQLNRDIPLPVSQQRSVYRMAVALGLSLLTVTADTVQARPLPPLIACGPAGKIADIPEQSTDSDTLKISGHVTDEIGMPFGGATVKLTLRGINKGETYADDSGAFSFPLPYNSLSEGLELQFSSQAYATKRIKIDQVMLEQGVSIQMTLDEPALLRGMIITQPPKHKQQKHKKRSKTASQTK